MGIFSRFSQNKIVINTHTYKFIIISLCNTDKVKEGYKNLDMMRKYKQSHDGEAYNTIMDASSNVDLLHLYINIWDDVFREGFRPNDQTYNIPILMFLKIGEVEEDVSLFKSIFHMSVPMDTLT